MENMLKDVTFEVDNGNKVKRFAVRCMRRGSKHRESSFGVLDVLTNTFVLLQHGRSRDGAKNVLNTCTVEQFNSWAKMIDDGMKTTASRQHKTGETVWGRQIKYLYRIYKYPLE